MDQQGESEDMQDAQDNTNSLSVAISRTVTQYQGIRSLTFRSRVRDLGLVYDYLICSLLCHYLKVENFVLI